MPRIHNKQYDKEKAHAPYNFVPFEKNPYYYDEHKKEVPAYNAHDDGLLTGYVTYKITAKTPVFSSEDPEDGEKQSNKIHEFYKNVYGNYAFRGSTIRGNIKANLQVLGKSSMWDDVDDYTLMFRDMTGGCNSGTYRDTLGYKQQTDKPSILENVSAGYITKKNGKYLIYPTINEVHNGVNYYGVSERHIIEKKLEARRNHTTTNYEYLFSGDRYFLQNKCEPFEKSRGRDNRVHYKGKPNPNFIPIYMPIDYSLNGNGNINGIYEAGQHEGDHSGYLLISGRMMEKKAIYIIPEIDDTEPVYEFSENDPEIRDFKADYKARENTLTVARNSAIRDNSNMIKALKAFFNLPEEGEVKPVFYIKGKKNFGFTPYLRLFNKFSIKQGMPVNQATNSVDYAKAMLGFAHDDVSLRSRVYFSDAVAPDDVTDMETVKYILGTPKPSDYHNYIDSDSDEIATYNTKGFYLRGAKNYWLKDEVDPESEGSDNVTVRFNPLPAGTEFTGTVRFRNLAEDELGLLLWSIRLNSESETNIGLAKGFGFGRVKFEIKDVKVVDKKKAYLADDLCLSPYYSIDIDDLISKYKGYMGISDKTIKNTPIETFLQMKNPTIKPDDSKIRYMTLNEYRDRDRNDAVLPKVRDLIKHI